MLHLRCCTLRKLFPFIDAGFQRELMPVACVKSSPDKSSLFLKNSHKKSHSACFVSNFHVIASHGFYLTTLQKSTPPKSVHPLQLNFQINKWMLATAKVRRILSCNVYACK